MHGHCERVHEANPGLARVHSQLGRMSRGAVGSEDLAASAREEACFRACLFLRLRSLYLGRDCPTSVSVAVMDTTANVT